MTSLFGGRGTRDGRIAAALAPGDMDGDRRAMTLPGLLGTWLRRVRSPTSPPDPSRPGGAPRRGLLPAALLCLSFATVLAGGAAAQEVSFSSGTYRVYEGDALTPELVLSHARSEDVTVRVEALDLGSAESGTDFAADPWHVTIPAGRTRQTFDIAMFDDDKREHSEEFLLHISPWGHSPGLRRSANGNPDAIAHIKDDTRISLTESRHYLWEGDTATIGVVIDNPRSRAFTLDYTLSGGTASSADVAGGFGTRSVAVPAYEREVWFSVTTAQDSVRNEGTETFSVQLSTSEPNVVFDRGTADVSISDDDMTRTVTFDSASSSADEGAGTHHVTVRLSPAPIPGGVLILRYQPVYYWSYPHWNPRGTATPHLDYEVFPGRERRGRELSIEVPAGATTVRVPVAIYDDLDLEGDETVVLKLLGFEDTWLEGRWRIRHVTSYATHRLTIVDNDAHVSFASTSQSVREGSGTHDVTLNLTVAPASPVTLSYTVGGTATPGADYAALSGTVTVPAGATTATVPVTILADGVNDAGETVVLTLTGGAGYPAGRQDTHTLFIDPVPTVTSYGLILISEDVGTYNVPVHLSPPPASDITLYYSAGGRPQRPAPTPGLDYEPLPGTLTVPAGTAVAYIPVTIIDDDVEDSGEVLRLTLVNKPDYTLGSSHVELFISNHESGGLEGQVQARLDLAVADGDSASASLWRRALAAVRGEAPPDGLAPLTGADATALADEHTGRGETELASLWEEIAGVIGDSATNPPPEPAVTIAAGASPVTEGEDAAFTLTADPAPASPLAVTVTVATDGAWGISAGPRTVTVPTSGSATLTLPTTGDGADEPHGSVTVTVTDGNGYTVGSSASDSVAIQDDDEPALAEPAVTIVAGTSPVTEGGSATFTLTATPPPAADLAVSVTVAADGDWGVTVGSRTVTIPTTGSATLTLATTDDATDEPDGSVTVTVTDGDGYTVGAAASGSITIEDDDAPATTPDWTDYQTVVSYLVEVRDNPKNTAVKGNPVHIAKWNRVLEALGHDTGTGVAPMAASEIHANAAQWPDSPFNAASVYLKSQEQQQEPAVTVSAGTSPVTEGADASFTLTATPAPAADLAVNVTVATDGDYGITAGSRTVTIPPTGSATLTLATTGDNTDEPDGSVTVTVNDAAGYTVGDPASDTVAVRDDDVPVVTVSGGAAVTEGGDAVFTLTASPAPAAALPVSVTVATDGEYGITAGTQTVTLPTTGSATLTLATTDDTTDEPDGSATVTVQTGSGYTVGTPASGTVAVRDDDLPPPVVTIAAKAASVTEGGDAVFTLTADRAPAAALTVELAVSETGEGDHVAAADEGPATVTIAKDTTEAVFTLATVNDAVDEPDTSATVTVQPGAGYTVGALASGTVTVKDDDASASAVLSVGDSTAKEGARFPVMAFTVRLSSPAQGPVRVYVSTRPSAPVSARPGQDYAPGSSDLTFRAGETEKQVWILIYDDSHDEGAETFEVVLSQAKGATIGDGVAVGTIVNDDPMPAAWLGRFGRTVAEQALDGIAGRMSAPRTPGMRGVLAGRALDFDAPAGGAPGAWSGPGPGAGDAATGASTLGGTDALALADITQAFSSHPGHSGIDDGFGHDAAGFGASSPPPAQSLTMREALLGSSFTLTGERDASGGAAAFWGRASQGSFDGAEGTFSLDGEATTALLGADYARGRWLIGLALAQSAGEGEYRDTKTTPRPPSQLCDQVEGETPALCNGAVRTGDGRVEASLTAALPYASVQASEWLKLWGAAGYGAGEVTLETAMGGNYTADTTWRMAAAGLRGDLLGASPEASGPALALTSDALWTRTSSERTRDLAASDSDATRLRLGLEGSWRIALDGAGPSETGETSPGPGRRAQGASLVPKLELGARHDGGDAETGFGIELGGGLAWSDPALGLTLDVSGRTLLAHENDALKDRGFSAALGFDPDPATERGPSLSLRQEFGGQSKGGLDALFQSATLEDRAGSEATSRWAVEAAYGLPALGGRWTGSPHVGFGLATGARDWSVGWRLAPEAANAPDFSFGLRATRRESDAAAPEHTLGFEIRATW